MVYPALCSRARLGSGHVEHLIGKAALEWAVWFPSFERKLPLLLRSVSPHWESACYPG